MYEVDALVDLQHPPPLFEVPDEDNRSRQRMGDDEKEIRRRTNKREDRRGR
jgi:hypothetical protein